MPDLIIDNGGEMTALVARDYPDMFASICGITEETSTGVHRLYNLAKKRKLQAVRLSRLYASVCVCVCLFVTFLFCVTHSYGLFSACNQRQPIRDQSKVRQPVRLQGVDC